MCSRIFENKSLERDNIIKFKSCHDIQKFLKDLSALMKQPNTRCLTKEQLQCQLFIFQAIISINDCQCTPNAVPTARLCIEMYRCLRNSCVESAENQNQIRRFTELYEAIMTNFKSLLKKVQTSETESGISTDEDIVSFRCGLQFFGNFLVGNEENKYLLWQSLYCKPDKILECLLKFSDEKIVDYSAMVLFNLLNEENISCLLKNKEDLETFIHLLIHSFLNVKSHWSLLCLEKFCEASTFWETHTRLPINERLVLLDIIAELIAKQHPGTAEHFIQELSHWFHENVLDIVKCTSDSEAYEPIEVMKALSVLCSASVIPKFQMLQDNIKLLESSVNVLKAVHVLGKSGTNVFTTVQCLSAKDKNYPQGESSPAYGFKKDLVRLIGNLCSGHRECQNKVRELDGIPLLIDCCNIDINNPYIMQWCIFSIRNVMENNAENQAVLADITVTGQLLESPLLSELGLCVQEDAGGNITLKKL